MKKTIWIKSAAIMLAMCAICLFDVYAGPGSGGGGGGGGMSIYEGDPPTEADCLACHDDLGNPDRHHALQSLCLNDTGCLDCSCLDCSPDCPDCCLNCVNCWECLDCHTLEKNSAGAYVVSDTNCLDCHERSEIEGGPDQGSTNVHHQTDLYYARNCFACHN